MRAPLRVFSQVDILSTPSVLPEICVYCENHKVFINFQYLARYRGQKLLICMKITIKKNKINKNDIFI